jgi:addiction module RelE/StbE family toxin
LPEKEAQNRFQSFLTKSADKYFHKCTEKIQRQLDKHLDDIEKKPYMGYPLHGKYSGFWAIDSGQFRIIYEIFKEKKLLKIIAIGPRGDVYK